MNGKKTYAIAAILGLLVVLDGLTKLFEDGGTWEDVRVHIMALAVAGLGASLRHALSKLQGGAVLLLLLPCLALAPACTVIQHDVHIDEGAVQVWGKDVEALDGVVTPRATPGAPGEIPTAQSSGQRYILIQIYQGADSKQETTTDAKLDATVTPVP